MFGFASGPGGGFSGPTGATSTVGRSFPRWRNPFDENLLYYNAGRDQPIMWRNGRDPMHSGEFFAPALALHNRAITGWLDELARPIDTVGPTSFRGQEMGLSPTITGYHPGAQRDLMMNQLLNKYTIPTKLGNEALSGLKAGELQRSWQAEHAYDKERTAPRGFLHLFFG